MVTITPEVIDAAVEWASYIAMYRKEYSLFVEVQAAGTRLRVDSRKYKRLYREWEQAAKALQAAREGLAERLHCNPAEVHMAYVATLPKKPRRSRRAA